ncbi:hypothetical protein PsalN5692_03988 (plasmid) [Piscirickettsia salmonis]|nr:hypothetical protein [Piscirickettsia salmonis]QGP52479.1 hypothetical protein PsalN5692_03988 [Piscirickettsia salmonis]
MIYRHLNEKDRFYIEQRLSEGDSGTVAKNYSELQKGYFLVLSA